MADCILELISKNILSTLRTVTTLNGYTYTINPSRHSQHGDKPSNLAVIIHQTDPRLGSDETYDKYEWIQPYDLEIYVIQDQTDTTPSDEILNAVWADIYKALSIDHTRGGYAIDTTIQQPQYFRNIDGAFEGLTFVCEVQYRTDRLDPTSL